MAVARSSALALPNESRRHCDERIGVREHRVERLRVGIARCDCDLDGGCGLTGFCSRYGKRARFVQPTDSPSALRCVQASALRSSHRLIAKMTVANPCFAHGFEQFHRDAVRS
jgi:hypothetical protein